MTCANPNCNCCHRSKRKLRPLVISLIPQNNPSDSGNSNSSSRHEQITRMFTTHPSLATHFEPPIFSPGVPSRELRNRQKFLEHANNAGLIPDIEWEAICRALSEQQQQQTVEDHECVVNNNNSVASEEDNQEEEETVSSSKGSSEMKVKENGEKKHIVIDPFRYLAIETRIEPVNEEDDADNINCSSSPNDSTTTENKKQKKHWLEYKTTSLVPISPHRHGSAEDISLPYSMELWRKAKTLNRDRSVLACTLAHLMAMKTLVGDNVNETSLEDDDDGGFDFILEDNVRAFMGLEDDSTGCECANRIWDAIEASNDAPSECHMRYYGWLGSLPNLTWIYKNHLPRSAFNNDMARKECAVFPFPTNEDFELDGINATVKPEKPDEQETSSTPHFATPGGTAVWGTFAYTISSAAYRTLINQLQNDVGSLMWKGKRMRAFQAKAIDKVLPRHVKSEFGARSVHLTDRVAFVRGPMLGSLLHPQWEEGFCNSTECQYHLSCVGEDTNPSPTVNSDSSDNGSDVWDYVWLTHEERQIVNHRKESGKWVQKSDIAKITKEGAINNGASKSNNSSLGYRSSATMTKVIPLAVIGVMASFLSLFVNHSPALPLPRSALVTAFAVNTPIHKRYNRPSHTLMSTRQSIEDDPKRAKLGKVPILSRTIPIEIKDPTGLPREGAVAEGGNDSVGSDTKRLNVTIWEMDKLSDLIQEWWSIDESEHNARVGDPFGVVMWPGSILASMELMKQHYSHSTSKSPITNATVLVLGAGTGVEAQTAALLGAKTVIATDINPLTLKLLEYGANVDDRIGNTVEAKYFDLFSEEALPACDILIAADVLYNPDLANQVGRRLHEAIVRSFEEGKSPTKVVVTDSQKFHGTNFLEEVAELKELNTMFEEGDWEQLKWETEKLENVCGSGVLVDEDQVYDVEIRMILWGW